MVGALALSAVLCAGDGEPPRRPWAASALVRVAGLPASGSARLALCGRLALRRGELIYSLGYQPERRLLVAELGYPLLRWLTLSTGVRKVAFSYAHDEPEQTLALPLRPALATRLAPDRRLGLTVDDDWGAVRVITGVYASAPTLASLPQSGLLATARGVMEPLGPVGRSLSTLGDDPYWRQRLRIAFNISGLVLWEPRQNLPLGLALGGDIPIKFGPLGLVVEYIYAHGAPLTQQSAWAQAAWMLLRPYLELSGRYEWLDDTSDARQRFQGLTLGVTGYALGSALKVQVAYGHKFPYAGPPQADNSLLVLAQIAQGW